MYNTPFHTDDLSKYAFLVTGGAGFIGSHIVEYLLTFGAKKVVVLDNLLTGFYKNIKDFEQKPAFQFIEGDIRDLEICRRACEGVDYVLHQAALGSIPRSIEDPLTVHAVNVTGFLNILLAARENGAKRLIYASSSSVYGDNQQLPKKEAHIGRPLSPYAATKQADELFADCFTRVYNMQIIGLRYFNVFGPRQHPEGPYAAAIPIFIKALLNNEEVFIYGDGKQTRDFTFVANIVQANIKAVFTNDKSALTQIYNVGFGKNASILDLYAILNEHIGAEKEPEFKAVRIGDVQHSLADISKAKKYLAYNPGIGLKEGLIMTVKYFKNSF